jgi:glycosyltransferase involved in cell wall biosynthesis
MDKTVSVIIPAYNEEKFIAKTLEEYQKQNYPLEIIVVVNNSSDQTYSIAKKYTNNVLNFPEKIGVSRARNEGARVANGDIFIFSDADCYLENGAIEKILKHVNQKTIGSPLGKADISNFKNKIFFFLKNWIYLLKIYQGVVGGILICSKDIFEKVGGFDKNKKIAEFSDLFIRAKKNGAEYHLFNDCYGFISMRRYKQEGYIKVIIFWLKWKILSIFNKDKKITEKYFK